MEIKDILALMKAVSAYALTDLELEQGDTRLVIRRKGEAVIMEGTPQPVSAVQASPAVQEDPAEAVALPSDRIVTCPLVGTFYSSPSPEAADFVRVGDTVKKGQVIGIVEAMKLMNEIECEYDGVVEAVLVKNEDTVEYGQPLFRIR
ncbi:MAG: acetyl-CoA carboxylase biotin carboxyl carrier protein [Lachnospiraceae bacterium]|jgi:acetyl-CoA carboxylase biotin carboxyl carrier protein|nr:acetyl-CoA carboxylase biotin carboxyl carrier protein [Lachnospiraceae bacterium]